MRIVSPVWASWVAQVPQNERANIWDWDSTGSPFCIRADPGVTSAALSLYPQNDPLRTGAG